MRRRGTFDPAQQIVYLQNPFVTRSVQKFPGWHPFDIRIFAQNRILGALDIKHGFQVASQYFLLFKTIRARVGSVKFKTFALKAGRNFWIQTGIRLAEHFNGVKHGDRNQCGANEPDNVSLRANHSIFFAVV
ncbi:MAG: hypothetical protein A2Z96_03410 [Spirochaetes bacterium GWB1_48_6]|nr:MAG: hypothetical protein A2Z96_03410 [Spirochaetes bacterium GWB1_48_6]